MRALEKDYEGLDMDFGAPESSQGDPKEGPGDYQLAICLNHNLNVSKFSGARVYEPSIPILISGKWGVCSRFFSTY